MDTLFDFEDQAQEPKPPYSETCPQCKGEITLLYTWGVWSCDTCKIKISQTKEEGIAKIEPLAVFRIDPMERSKEG
jgi:ribosomal protein L37AE/L43A